MLLDPIPRYLLKEDPIKRAGIYCNWSVGSIPMFCLCPGDVWLVKLPIKDGQPGNSHSAIAFVAACICATSWVKRCDPWSFASCCYTGIALSGIRSWSFTNRIQNRIQRGNSCGDVLFGGKHTRVQACWELSCCMGRHVQQTTIEICDSDRRQQESDWPMIAVSLPS